MFRSSASGSGLIEPLSLTQTLTGVAANFSGAVSTAALSATTGAFSGAVTTSAALQTTQGQKLTFDGAAGAKYLSSDGTTLTLTGLNLSAGVIGGTTSVQTPLLLGPSGNTRIQFASGNSTTYKDAVASPGATDVAHIFDTSAAYSTAGGKLISIRNNGSEVTTIDRNGACVFGTITISNLVTTTGSLSCQATGNNFSLGGRASNISGGIALKVYNQNTLNTAGAQIVGFYNDSAASTQVLAIDKDGRFVIPTGGAASIAGQATLSSGTVTVSTTSIKAGSKVFFAHVGSGTAANFGTLYKGTVTAGTSFVINSTNASDNDAVEWWIVN
jgi:hypothetical protein